MVLLESARAVALVEPGPVVHGRERHPGLEVRDEPENDGLPNVLLLLQDLERIRPRRERRAQAVVPDQDDPPGAQEGLRLSGLGREVWEGEHARDERVDLRVAVWPGGRTRQGKETLRLSHRATEPGRVGVIDLAVGLELGLKVGQQLLLGRARRPLAPPRVHLETDDDAEDDDGDFERNDEPVLPLHGRRQPSEEWAPGGVRRRGSWRDLVVGLSHLSSYECRRTRSHSK